MSWEIGNDKIENTIIYKIPMLPPVKTGPTFRRKLDPFDRQNADGNFRILNPSDFSILTCNEKTIDK